MLAAPGLDAEIPLTHVDHPDDNNGCTFVSSDVDWRLQYDYGEEAWVLEQFSTGNLWATSKADWLCNDLNVLVSDDESLDNATVNPVYDCKTTSWDCVNGACVEIAGSSGPYASRTACLAAGCGGTVTACGCSGIPRLLYAHFTGAISGTVPLAYSSASLAWLTTLPAPCHSTATDNALFNCNLDGTFHFACPDANPGGTSFAVANEPASCSPFLWTQSGTAFGSCAGVFTVTVDTNP
jgi:hypothetical protein